MKRRFFSTVLFVVLCLFALNLKGDVSWETHPVITSFPLEFNKYINIVSGEVSWYHGNIASVYVSADLNGVGEGVATLKKVYLVGKKEVETYGGQPKYFGIKNPDGSWRNVSANISVGKKVEIPDKAVDGNSWDWGAGEFSEIRPTPWGWKETTSQGFTISIPAGITGRFSTTGGWAAAGSAQPERTAPARSGTHSLVVKYICRQCNASGKTKAEMGGKSAHEKITCPAPNCSVQYHKCSPPSSHAVCDGCGKRKCEDGDHSYVGTCNGEYVHYTTYVAGCGEKIYGCTRSQHQVQTYSCGHTMKACQYASHSCAPPPTDDTPNCQDCTSHCSSPCSCTNSGTCNGTMTDNTPNCSGCTSHCSSPCNCSDSGTCNGTVAAPPTPTPTPPSPTLCPADEWTGCGSTTSHAKTCGGGHLYYTCNPSAVAEHAPSRECRRSGCDNTWARCQKAPMCDVWSGNKCWAL